MSPRTNLSKLLDCPEDGIVRHEGYKQFTYGARKRMTMKLTIQEFNGIMKNTELEICDVPHRKKFIGIRFKQGDFGIVFAYRGIGKTWLH
jgi:hypothetical protein